MKKLTNGQIVGMYYALPSLGNLKGVKFNHGIDKNRKRLKKEVESIEESIKPSKEFEEYDKLRIEINEKFSVKNEDGSPKMSSNQNSSRYIIDENKRVEFDKEQEILKKKHSVIVETREKQLKEYRELLLEENTTFISYPMKVDVIPEDVTGDQFELISYFLEDDEVSKEETSKSNNKEENKEK